MNSPIDFSDLAASSNAVSTFANLRAYATANCFNLRTLSTAEKIAHYRETIPAAMQLRDAWILVGQRHPDATNDKTPVDPTFKGVGSPSFLSFRKALELLASDEQDSCVKRYLGYVPKTGHACIDIDDLDSLERTPEAIAYIDEILKRTAGGFVEISIGRNGLHIFFSYDAANGQECASAAKLNMLTGDDPGSQRVALHGEMAIGGARFIIPTGNFVEGLGYTASLTTDERLYRELVRVAANNAGAKARHGTTARGVVDKAGNLAVWESEPDFYELQENSLDDFRAFLDKHPSKHHATKLQIRDLIDCKSRGRGVHAPANLRDAATGRADYSPQALAILYLAMEMTRDESKAIAVYKLTEHYAANCEKRGQQAVDGRLDGADRRALLEGFAGYFTKKQEAQGMVDLSEFNPIEAFKPKALIDVEAMNSPQGVLPFPAGSKARHICDQLARLLPYHELSIAFASTLYLLGYSIGGRYGFTHGSALRFIPENTLLVSQSGSGKGEALKHAKAIMSRFDDGKDIINQLYSRLNANLSESLIIHRIEHAANDHNLAVGEFEEGQKLIGQIGKAVADDRGGGASNFNDFFLRVSGQRHVDGRLDKTIHHKTESEKSSKAEFTEFISSPNFVVIAQIQHKILEKNLNGTNGKLMLSQGFFGRILPIIAPRVMDQRPNRSLSTEATNAIYADLVKIIAPIAANPRSRFPIQVKVDVDRVKDWFFDGWRDKARSLDPDTAEDWRPYFDRFSDVACRLAAMLAVAENPHSPEVTEEFLRYGAKAAWAAADALARFAGMGECEDKGSKEAFAQAIVTYLCEREFDLNFEAFIAKQDLADATREMCLDLRAVPENEFKRSLERAAMRFRKGAGKHVYMHNRHALDAMLETLSDEGVVSTIEYETRGQRRRLLKLGSAALALYPEVVNRFQREAARQARR